MSASARPAHIFEPSTWAEVEDAAVSRKASLSRVSHQAIPTIIAFTEYPARCLNGSIPDLPPQPFPSYPTSSTVQQAQSRQIASHQHSNSQRHSQTTQQSGAEQQQQLDVSRQREQREYRLSNISAHEYSSEHQLHDQKTGDITAASDRRYSLHNDHQPSDNHQGHLHHLPPVASFRPKRSPQQIEDLLGLGRVDLETQTLMRRYTIDSANARPVPVLPSTDPQQTDFISPLIHPASPLFNSALYLARIHRDTPLLDLAASRHRVLSGVSEALNSKTENLRAESHAQIALAASAVDSVRRSAHTSSPFAELLGKMKHENDFDCAVNVLDDKYQHILNCQLEIDRFKHAWNVAKRFGWLLKLPSTLKASKTANISEIEQTTRQLSRASTWLKAQEGPSGPSRRWIEQELRRGLSVFVETLEDRLSRKDSSDVPHLSRVIAVLEVVDHERVVHAALAVRVNSARESLRKAARMGPISAVVRARVGGTGGGHADAVELVTRLSRAFVDGLAHVWNLARILIGRPKYNDAVDMHVPSLIAEYTENVRLVLLKDLQVVTSAALGEIDRTRAKASNEIRVPSTFLAPLHETIVDVTRVHVASLVQATKTCCVTVAQNCFENGTIGTQVPHLSLAMAEEILAEVRDVDFASIEVVTTKKQNGQTHADADSSAFVLAKTCIRIPELVLQRLRELTSDISFNDKINSGSVTSSSQKSPELPSVPGSESFFPSYQTSLPDFYGSCMLGIARSCCEFVENGIGQSIYSAVKDRFNDHVLDVLHASVTARIRAVLQESIRLYCTRMTPEVRRSARRITELRSAEGLRTSQSMDIVSASAQAVEVLMNVSLAICRARQLGADDAEVVLIQRELTEQVANVVTEAMRATGGAADMAAQIWVDVSFLIGCLCDAKSLGSEIAKAAEIFMLAKDLAADAIRLAGFSFGTAEEQNLHRTAVEPSVQRAKLLRQAMEVRASDISGV